MQTETETPRAWVGCLGCYNAGKLVGQWVDGIDAGDLTPEDLHDGPTECEEMWVMDHENYAGTIKGECSPSHAAEVAAVLDEVPEHQGHAFAAFVEWYGTDSDAADTVQAFEDHYTGEWDSPEDYAAELMEGSGMLDEVPEHLRYYIDTAAYARDLFMGDMWSAPAPVSGIYVFRSNA